MIYGKKVVKEYDEEILPSDSPLKRLKDESERSYRMFREYVKQTIPRRVTIVAAQFDLGEDHIYRLSSTHHWRDRSRQYDEMISSAETRGLIKAAEDMAGGHLRALGKVRFLCERNIDRLLKECQGREGKGASLSPREIVSMLDRCVHYERLIMGEATERVDEAKRPDLSRLSDDDLERLAEIEQKMYGLV